MKINDKVKYSKIFLQSLGSTFTEEEFKEFNAIGVVKSIKPISTCTSLCVVDFNGIEKRILNKNLIIYSDNLKVFLEKE